MRDGHVVALVVHVAHRLPVHGQLLGPELAAGGHHRLRCVGCDFRIVTREHLRDRRLVAGQESDEDEPHPDLHLHGFQPMLDPIQPRQAVREGGAAQGPVEVVAPAMERAGDRAVASPAAPGDDTRAAVAAQVVERANAAVCAAQDQGAFACHVERNVVARLRDIRHVARQLPVTAEQDIPFQLRQLLVVVGPRRQSAAVPVSPSRRRHDIITHHRLHQRHDRADAGEVARGTGTQTSTVWNEALTGPGAEIRLHDRIRARTGTRHPAHRVSRAGRSANSRIRTCGGACASSRIPRCRCAFAPTPANRPHPPLRKSSSGSHSAMRAMNCIMPR